MEVVDSQVHMWEQDRPERPWDPQYGAGGPSAAAHRQRSAEHVVNYEQTLQAMDEAGVDAAVVVTTIIYGWDNGYSLEARTRYPDRFAVMGRVDPYGPDLEERVVAWRDTPGAVGIRVVATTPSQREEVQSGALDRFFAVCETRDVPVAIFAPRFLRELVPVCERFPEMSLHLDHLGLPQPPLIPPDPDRFQRLPDLLDLARYPKVAVKLSAAPTLSTQPYPFEDLWPPIHAILRAYGTERVMWGSDWTRVADVVSYRDQVHFILESNELSEDDKEAIMGRSLRTLLRWPKRARAGTA